MSKNRREWQENPKKNRKDKFNRQEEEFESLEDRERPNFFKEEKRKEKKRKSA
ncbi:MAG TPA: hypothetical protein VLF61_01260 [Rhabdochlamydiaceae bacterium]|nr:hypothetical protein [Rhabdochlamydiaceae bacterium]